MEDVKTLKDCLVIFYLLCYNDDALYCRHHFFKEVVVHRPPHVGGIFSSLFIPFSNLPDGRQALHTGTHSVRSDFTGLAIAALMD
jgi:hypothetical protein